MALIGIEEHWTTPELTAALKSLPDGDRDESLAFNEMGDKLARLEDIGQGRIAGMDEQGIDIQILGLAPPGTGPLAPADAVALSRDANDSAGMSRKPAAWMSPSDLRTSQHAPSRAYPTQSPIPLRTAKGLSQLSSPPE